MTVKRAVDSSKVSVRMKLSQKVERKESSSGRGAALGIVKKLHRSISLRAKVVLNIFLFSILDSGVESIVFFVLSHISGFYFIVCLSCVFLLQYFVIFKEANGERTKNLFFFRL